MHCDPELTHSGQRSNQTAIKVNERSNISYIVSKIWYKVANFIDGNCQFPVMEKDKDHICTDAIHNQPVVANNLYCCHANQMHWTNFMLSA